MNHYIIIFSKKEREPIHCNVNVLSFLWLIFLLSVNHQLIRLVYTSDWIVLPVSLPEQSSVSPLMINISDLLLPVKEKHTLLRFPCLCKFQFPLYSSFIIGFHHNITGIGPASVFFLPGCLKLSILAF